MAKTFVVTGSVGIPLRGSIQPNSQATSHRYQSPINNAGTTVSYTSVPLYTLLTTANPPFPTTGVKNGFLRDYVTITGTGGERAMRTTIPLMLTMSRPPIPPFMSTGMIRVGAVVVVPC
jgi:hypothetical protein